MDKKQLSRLRKLNKEAEVLKQEIKELEFSPREYVADIAKDYSTGYPVTIKIEGYGSEEYIKAKCRLQNRLSQKFMEIQDERERIEEYLDSVDDPELRTILRLKYINGLTQEQIAEEMGYSRSAVAMKIKRIR
ncbi:MAG: RNA polymerase sigma factor [Anaerovoracaceae bacterium]